MISATESAAGTLLFRVSGIDCPSCATTITRSLTHEGRVEDVQVDVFKGEVRVRLRKGGASREEVARLLSAAGYPVRSDIRSAPRPRGPTLTAAIAGDRKSVV